MNSYKGLLVEFKKKVVDWIVEHENEFQLVNACAKAFNRYIYDENGEFLIGGDVRLDFIKDACRLMVG